MGADYIPESDSGAARWMKTFARALVEDPSGYRTTSEVAAEIDSGVHAFRLANAKCRSPNSRTSPNVRGKNSARVAAEKLVRPEAQRIRTDPRIDAVLKLNIGLKAERQRRRHLGAPTSVPDLRIEVTQNGLIQIFARDSQSNRRARPRGAYGMELYEHVIPREEIGRFAGSHREAITLDLNGVPIGWRFVGVFTRTPFAIQPSSRNPGDVVSYIARWITRTGEPAAFSQPQSERIQFNLAPQGLMRTPLRHKLVS